MTLIFVLFVFVLRPTDPKLGKAFDDKERKEETDAVDETLHTSRTKYTLRNGVEINKKIL